MYANVNSIVNWKTQLSIPFLEEQEIRKSGLSSADKYKAGKNRVLNQLNKKTNSRIGIIPTGAIMVADNLHACLTSHNLYDMQTSLAIAGHDASRERHMFNLDKSKVIAINSIKTPNLMLNEKPLGTPENEPHLSMVRNSQNHRG